MAKAIDRAMIDGQDHLTYSLAVTIDQIEAKASRRWEAIDRAWDLAHAPAPEAPTSTAPESYPVTTDSSANWDAIAGCEASGDWGYVGPSAGGYYFALQFAPSTWLAYGGTQAELDAGVAPSRARLIQVAEAVLAGQGPGAWPNCFSY